MQVLDKGHSSWKHSTCRLGIPVAVQKTEGPSTTLVFLGILIDTYAFELRLPIDKLSRLQDLVW